MDYQIYSYRHGEIILQEPQFKPIYDEVLDVISSVTDAELKGLHQSRINGGIKSSLSSSINRILHSKFTGKGWQDESPIFQGAEYGGVGSEKHWRLDFAKAPISIEVAFNHGEAIAWNLLKPVLASELNHVQKAIQTEVGIIITATKSLKDAGAFDSAMGEYEKFLRYLKPLSSILSVPMVIIGLEAPQTFKLKSKYPLPGPSDWGKIIEI
jgi:hypothetical protein